MKKILAILLAMMMVFALAACGGGNDTPDPSGSVDNTPSSSGQQEHPGNNEDDGEDEENVTSTLYSDDTRLVLYNKQNPKRYYVFYYEGTKITGIEWYFPYQKEFPIEKENAQGMIDANLLPDEIKSQEDTGNCLIVALNDSVCASYDSIDAVREQYSDWEEIKKS